MLGKSILPTDEELGKKDDDHQFKPRARSRTASWWAGCLNPFRRRRRRLLLAVAGIYLLYLLLAHFSALSRFDLSLKTPTALWGSAIPSDVYEDEPTGAPPGTKKSSDGLSQHTYDGQIKFYRLAASLRGASHTNGYYTVNRNVLFAFASLKSAAALLPMACEMAKWNRNYVHVALLGREDIPLEHLLEINGVGKESSACPAIWHDARPDYTEYSSDTRAQSSVVAAMVHLHSYLHPQVVIHDDPLEEDDFFVRGMRTKANQLSIPIIEIPQDSWQTFMWMTRLDAGSLKSWHKPTVDILIQAPSGSTGGLVRLLKSLMEAEYSGLRPPRLTIDLPADVDPSIIEYLQVIDSPSRTRDGPTRPSQVSIHRRVSQRHDGPEESTIRFLEMFYPTRTADSHLLFLAHNTQLSPLYFHYLQYSLLEYRYSSLRGDENDSGKVMGLSLDRPAALLDGKTKLTSVSPSDMHARYRKLFPEERNIPFMWQAPNSNAALYFGDKWAELHSFLSNRIAKQRQSAHPVVRPKTISETLPAWTEYMLELMKARGYSLLHPAMKGSQALVTVHNELYHGPEEFSSSPSSAEQGAAEKAHEEAFSRAETAPSPPHNTESTLLPSSQSLHLALPFDGDLPEISHLPHLTTEGSKIAPANVTDRASVYAEEFRGMVGGCQAVKGKHRKVRAESAEDLFCFGDEDEDDWEVDWDAETASEDADTVDENEESWWSGISRAAGGGMSASASTTLESAATPSVED